MFQSRPVFAVTAVTLTLAFSGPAAEAAGVFTLNRQLLKTAK